MKKKEKTTYALPYISYILFIVMLLFVPLSFWKEFDNGFDLVKSSVLKITGGMFCIFSAIYLTGLFKKSKSADIYFDRFLDPLMIFFLISLILSTLFSVNVYLSFWGNYETQIGLLLYLNLFIIYLLLPSIINNEKKFGQILLAAELIALITAVFTLAEYFGLNPFNLKPTDFSRPVSPVGHPVFTAGFLTLLLPFSALNISGKKSLLLKVLVPLIILSGIIATQTRGTYAAAAVQFIILAFLYPFLKKSGALNRRKYFIYSGVFVLSAVLLIFLFIVFFPENTFVKRFLSISSITRLPRWYLWKDSAEMFFHYPVTGTGISAFSNAFEDFASYELKYAEIKGFFVNAHSNFLNNFCTTGIIGGIAYIMVLAQVLRISFKKIFSEKNNPDAKYFFLAFAVSIAGYAVFGIADFDDITILLYLFVLLSLFKIKNIKVSGAGSFTKKFTINRNGKLAAGFLIIAFSVYNIYTAYIDLYAQSTYSEGVKKNESGNILGYIEAFNSASEIKQNEPYYRFKFAYDLLVYSSGLSGNSAVTKKTLLERSKEEVTKAEKNYRSKLECLALKSLIELELGNEAEGFRLRDELFKTDTTRFPYRINLAVYYLNHNNDSAAIYEINSILNWDFKNIRAMTLKIYYLERKGLTDEAIETCKKILEIDPNNQFARNTLNQLESK